MTVWRTIRPLDVLYLRGNRLFGGGGDHSEALMPPWPSVFAGAIRSRMLVDAGVDLGRFTDEQATPPPELAAVLGTPSEPGSFRIATLALLAPAGDGSEPPRPVFPLPADTVVTRKERSGNRQAGRSAIPEPEDLEVRRLEPVELPAEISSSSPAPIALALRRRTPSKPLTGWWLTAEGLGRWLGGGTPEPEQLLHRSQLWKSDPRLGIATDRASGTAATGKLYTSETVAMTGGAGFLIGIEGATEDQVPKDGLLRLGGDGRGAEIGPWEGPQPLPAAATAGGQRFALYLETPGLFPGGWLPPGVEEGTLRLEVDGLTAHLAAAAVPRFEVVSGWNVAAHAPKPAQRVVPAGSVYLFDQVEGDPQVYLAAFWELIERSLGAEFDTVWKQRRAEGFSSMRLGGWEGGVTP